MDLLSDRALAEFITPPTELAIAYGGNHRWNQIYKPNPIPSKPSSNDIINNNYDKIVNNIEKHSRPNLSNEYVAPRNETEEAIAEIWQQVLGIDTVGIYDSLFELGGHSLLANLAATITQQQPKEDELAIINSILSEVSRMSPEEIRAQSKGSRE